MFWAVTKKQAILVAQQLYLIYSQSSTLYEVFAILLGLPLTHQNLLRAHTLMAWLGLFLILWTNLLPSLGIWSLHLNTQQVCLALLKHPLLSNPPMYWRWSPQHLRTTNNLVVKRIIRIINKSKIAQESQPDPQNQGGGTSRCHRKIKLSCTNFQREHLAHKCPGMDEVHRLLAPPQSTQYPVILTQPFLAQPQQQMVSQPRPPPQGGNEGPFSYPTHYSSVFMCK